MVEKKSVKAPPLELLRNVVKNGHFNEERRQIKGLVNTLQREQVKFRGLQRKRIGHAISDLKSARNNLP